MYIIIYILLSYAHKKRKDLFKKKDFPFYKQYLYERSDVQKLSVFSFPLSSYLVGLKLTVLIMSPKTPAAVTPAPAPYPRTVRGIGV